MTDDGKKADPEVEFATLLDAYSPSAKTDMQVGDKVRGKIISISNDTIFLDIGTKIDGVVETAEMLDKNKQLPHQEGDTVELYIIELREDEIRLSKALSGVGSFELLKEACEKEVPVEGRVVETCKGGLRVEVMGRKAFCPASQIDINFVEALEDYVDQTHQFLIKQVDARDKNVIISRRALLSRELEKSQAQFYKRLQIGDVLDGRITKRMPYGVFVELHPGIDGLVHVSELSWSRVEDPQTFGRMGEPVRIKVIDIEKADVSDRVKISLSIKQVTADPWLSANDRFKVGDKVNGRVTRCTKFGAFVEIADGIEGLVHISEMSYQKRILKPEEIVTPGESVFALIKDLDIANRRIALSIRDAEGDPWNEVPQKYKAGQAVEGVIEKKEKFGYFITLSPGVSGLLPKSKISQSPQSTIIEKLKEGNSIPVLIEEILIRDRKITLAPGASEDEQDWQQFTTKDQSSMGSLGEKLQRALASTSKTKE
ncbi:MAG: S1 RNA-binding domain-containing protein [Desulfobacterales bacterium]|jgi:small subunit ribosomal protein S1